MAVETWGSLPKAQDDNETIEEAIARLVGVHDEAEASHLQTGQSLEQHKSEEQLDHPVDSVIESNIIKQSVTPDKLDYDKYFYTPSFDSLDSWFQTKAGTNADIIIGGGALKIQAGDFTDDLAYLFTQGQLALVDSTKDPYFSFLTRLGDAGAQMDAFWLSGTSTPLVVALHNAFGFYWKGSEEKLYGRYIKNQVAYDVEITGFVPTSLNLLRVELDDSANEIRFYLNGVLKETVSTIGFSVESESLLAFGSKALDNGSDTRMMIINLVFAQNN